MSILQNIQVIELKPFMSQTEAAIVDSESADFSYRAHSERFIVLCDSGKLTKTAKTSTFSVSACQFRLGRPSEKESDVPLEKFFPPIETALQLGSEELAVHLLKYLVNQQESASGNLNLHNFIIGTDLRNYSENKYAEVAEAMTEAWIWLERELMLAPTPGKERQWLYVTGRGKTLAATGDIGKYKRSNIIPPGTLDPVLASKVAPLFIRGDYDTAVFQAFKEVEIRVRMASSFPQELIGTDLMRSAFNPDSGKLTDTTRPKAEREATSHLFAGAIGLFKNPSSHRDVNWEDPIECVELLYLANHLLRIVEKHTSGN